MIFSPLFAFPFCSALILLIVFAHASSVYMGKKRKHAEASEAPKEEVAQERPKRTLLGWKDGVPEKQNSSPVFRNREKVLVTCSRRITYR